jgi:hypothetical protein
MGPRCSSAETHVCHRSYIIAARIRHSQKELALHCLTLKDIFDCSDVATVTSHGDINVFILLREISVYFHLEISVFHGHLCNDDFYHCNFDRRLFPKPFRIQEHDSNSQYIHNVNLCL